MNPAARMSTSMGPHTRSSANVTSRPPGFTTRSNLFQKATDGRSSSQGWSRKMPKGGSVTTASTQAAGRVSITSLESPTINRTWSSACAGIGRRVSGGIRASRTDR